MNVVKKKKIKVIVVKKGDKVTIEKGIYFDILWPQEKLINENVLNNNAIVTKLHYNQFSMLFTGDIEEKAERLLLEQNIDLKSNVLKVAHHGSKTSTTQEFLDIVKPQIALIGVGKNNNFGHPNEEVIQRLFNQSCKVYRTDQLGEVVMEITEKAKIKILLYKFNRFRRYY